MALHRTNGELFTERRSIDDAVFNSFEKSDHGSRVLRRGRKFGRITKHKLSRWIFLLTALLSILLTVYGLKMFFQGEDRDMCLFSSPGILYGYIQIVSHCPSCIREIQLHDFSLLVFIDNGFVTQLKWNPSSQQYHTVYKKNVTYKKILWYLMMERRLKKILWCLMMERCLKGSAESVRLVALILIYL